MHYLSFLTHAKKEHKIVRFSKLKQQYISQIAPYLNWRRTLKKFDLKKQFNEHKSQYKDALKFQCNFN